MKLKKNMKGKETLSDKISGANISDWKEHKLMPLGFFELMKLKFHFPEEMAKTYSNLVQLPPDIDKSLSDLVENDPKFNKLEDSARERIKEVGDQLMNLYLHNGLPVDEVNKRKEVDGPNKLPEKKKTPAIILLIEECTTLFSCLLWIAAGISLIGYGLASDDASYVKTFYFSYFWLLYWH